MAKQWLIGLIIVVLGLGGVAGYRYIDQGGEETAETSQSSRKVNVVTPSRQAIRDTVTAVGSLRAREAVELTTEVSGRVVELNLRSGTRVEQGSLLVRLDDRQALAEVAIAEARLEDARRQYERTRSLRSNNSVSQSQVDELRTVMEVAEAELQSARTRLDNHRIEAPFGGVVGLSNISNGAYLTAGTTLTTLDATDPMELGFSVPERYLGELHIGQAVRGSTPAFPDQPFEGELAELGTRISELSRTLPVKALVRNPDGRLRPGQFMSVSLTLRTREALVIPEQAILLRGDQKFVFVAEDGQARRLEVSLGARQPGIVEVTEGLGPDDRVIITGQDRLSSGDRIEAVKDDSAIPDNHLAGRQES